MQFILKNKEILLKLCLNLVFLIGMAKTEKIEGKISLDDLQGLVVGGENARPKEFPFAARLGHVNNDEKNVNWFCGGTLLSKTFVLTAAHCFYAALGDVNRVRLGELDFNSETDDAMPEDFNVKELIEHPEYNYGQPYNDIGLVMLSLIVKFDLYKSPACLPISTEIQNFNFLIAVGWGYTRFSGQSASHLKKVTLRYYSNSNCSWLAEGLEGRERLPDGLKDSQLCAGSPVEKDTCRGDSGGPLLASLTKYPRICYVVGITSVGVGGCASPNVPAIYTNVNDYIDWIRKYIDYN